ncbi:MAG TPA: SGNH/GDSL hydrolase family protein, partial [Phycisphaerae bacterium]|nr:SGNH/GDSL hydrolase family protein [Phycisphaerae bacterium]
GSITRWGRTLVRESPACAAALVVAAFSWVASTGLGQTPGTQPASAPAPATAPASQPVPQPQPVPEPPPPPASQPQSAPAPATATAPATAPAAESQPQGEAEPALAVRSGDVVVFLGDDLTDTPRPTTTNSFPMLVETFLTARYPGLAAHFINVGWSGDTVARALLRLDRDVLSHEPDVVVVCLGLNDPEYLPFSEDRLAAYRKDLLQLVEKCKAAGARVWLISPPSVDEEKGRKVRIQRGGRPGTTDLQAVRYNATLARYAEATKEVAQQTGSGFVDWFAQSAEAFARGRQAGPDFSLTTNGLHPNDRAHAMVAASLLKAWGAQPIETRIEVGWASGEVKVSSHLAAAAVARAEINASGERRIVLQNLPLPWPMAGGQAGFMGHDWEAAAMCRFMLVVPDAPERGVLIRMDWPQGPAVHDEPVPPEQLRDGFNLAGTEALHQAKEATELFQLIGTKNYYHYGTWRKLALSPPKEAELVEAHRKLIEAWNSYVAGTERIIQNQPKVLGLHLVLSEAVPIEQLPTTTAPPAAPATSSQAESVAAAPGPQPAAVAAPAPEPAATQPAAATAPATTQPAASQPASQPG